MAEDQQGTLIRTLGPLLVECDGVPRTVPGAVPRRLLAALVLHRNTEVRLDLLVDVTWGAAEPPSSTATIRSHVSRLRRQLPSILTIDGTNSGYRLSVPPGLLDVDAFETALARAGRCAASDPPAALRSADAALVHWRGRPYPDLSDHAIAAAEIGRLDELHGAAVELRLDALIATGERDRAIAEMQAFALLVPDRERIWTKLMRALWDVGRSREALLAANTFRSRLADAAGLEPSPAFAELEATIAGAPTAMLAASHRAALAPGDRMLTSGRLSSFHGRADDLDAVTGLLRDHRLVTLLGAGGMGKTRLAMEVAALTAARGTTTTWFCSLTDVRDADPSSLPYFVASSIGLEPHDRSSAAQALAVWIGATSALLVLDNCEELRGEVAGLALGLLGRCPNLTILATSRDAFGLPGEARWMLGPLDEPAAQALFVARLTSMSAAPARGRHDPAVAALCRRLDGMPLAIELAAAACRVLTPDQLAARLDDEPEVLVDRARPPGRESLQTVLTWSVQRLRPIARHVFARLSTFQGGCALEQAEAVGAGDGVSPGQVVGALGELFDAGLVGVRHTATGLRYVQVEPIRQHGARLLAEHEAAATSARHAQAYAGLARDIGAGLRTGAFPEWLEVANVELANLRAAHRWSIDHDDLASAVAIVAGLRDVLNEQLTTEICDWNDETVAAARTAGGALEAEALTAATIGWMHQRRYEEVYDAHAKVMAADVTADVKAQAAWSAGWCHVNGGNGRAAPAIWSAARELRPSEWYDTWLRASLALGNAGRPSSPDEHAALTEQLRRLGSPSLQRWYQIWTARIVGPPTTLDATGSMLRQLVADARRRGAVHACCVGLCIGVFVEAQRTATPTPEVLGILGDALEHASRLQLPVSLLTNTLEAAGYVFALRGLPSSAHTVFAALDAQGGLLWRTFRNRLAGHLDDLPAEVVAASEAAARELRSLDDLASYVRAVMAGA